MINKKFIWQDKAKLRKNHLSWQLDLTSLGGKRNFYSTKDAALKALKEFHKRNKTEIEESDNWTLRDLLGEFPNDSMMLEWDQRIKNNEPLSTFYWKEYTRMKKGKPLPQYYKEYKEIFNTICSIKILGKEVGDFVVRDLRQDHCENYIMAYLENSGKKGKRGYKTLVGIKSRFNKLMQHAKKARCINENPMLGVVIERSIDEDLESKPKEKLSTDFINEVEVLMPKSCTLAYKFACSTGLRAGEQRALTWNDIDFKTFEVSINKAAKLECIIDYEIVRNGVGRVKTRTSNRLVPVNGPLIRKLQELYIKRGRPEGSELIFGTKFGTMVNASTWREQLQATIKKITNKHLVWHDLRHYYASKQLEFYGDDVWTVSNLMGHSNVDITQKTYGHWMLDTAKKQKLKEDQEKIWGS